MDGAPRAAGPLFFSAGLDGADGEGDDVVGGHGFLLEEGLAVFGADKLAVVAGQEIHAVVELIDRQEDALLAFALGGAELGAIGEDGFAALRVLLADIHDESGRHAFEGSGVENFERAVGFAGERKLLESCEEATFVAERRSVIVVGMPRFPIRKDDGVGLKIADELREAHFVLASGLHIGIRDAEVSTPGDFQDFGGQGSFFGACFGSAAGSHFTGGEVKNAGFVPLLGHFDQRATAGEFNVVWMRCDGKNVEFHGEASKNSSGL